MRALSLVILALWVLALLRTIVNLRTVPRLRVRRPSRSPRVSVIIPARDEERTIGRTVAALLAQTWDDLEVIVVNDRSTDRTAEILRSFAADPRLTVIDGVDPQEGWLGKPWALHQGSLRATGELLLFVDADIIYGPDTVAAAVAEMEESGVSMITLFPRVEMVGFWENVVMPLLAFVAYSVAPLWLSNRSRRPFLAMGGGTGNLVLRRDYDAAGGHVALRDAVIDDIGLGRLMRRGGLRTAVVLASDMISVRMYHGLGEIVDGFTKNTFAALGRSYMLVAAVLILGVTVHLFPYALVFTGDPIALAIVATITATRVVLFRSCRYRLDAALFAHPLMMAVWFVIVLRSTWLTGIRRRLVWRGRSYDAQKTRFG